jgi:uncharacterized Zn-binding protein involved in type VI secretion
MAQQPVARLGDTSDHGGVIISSGSKYRCDGILVARVGDLHSCPIPGHGITAINTGSGKVRSEGKSVAAITSVTGCGANIITGSPTTRVPMEPGGEGTNGQPFTLDDPVYGMLDVAFLG